MKTLADAVRRADRRVLRDSARQAISFRLSASPSHLLRRADQFAAEIFLKNGGDGVTLRQTVLLAAIAEAEGASQSDLVRATGVDRSTLAEMMARMERKGLIARRAAADDGRAKSVKLTADGRSKLLAALPAMRRVDDALIRSLPKEKRNSFRSTLTALAVAADEAHDLDVAELKKAKKAVKAQKAASKLRRLRKSARKGRGRVPGR